MSRAAVLACLATAGTLLGACATPQRHPARDGAATVDVSVSTCGRGWTHPHAGSQQITLHNTDTRSGEVYLTDARTGAVYTETDNLAAGTTTTVDVDLGSGSYAFRCAMEDEAVITGPTVTIPGTATGTAARVLPVTQADLVVPTKRYESYVSAHLPVLRARVASLQTAVDRGDLGAARQAWLPAHLEYEQLGAAYGAFGDLDAQINGLPSGLPRGVHDPDWQGFHRVEYGLWHGDSAPTVKPLVNALATAVDKLSGEFATAQVDPLDLAIRAHEITENALQFELTGQSDFGSHSNLATVLANLDGTRAVLAIIRPVLDIRYPGLHQVDAQLTQASADLRAQQHDGRWTPLSALTRPQRERLDADISSLCESLAPIASILEPRRASS